MSETTNPKERRLVLRLLDYWRDLCGERDLPAVSDVDGGAIPDMWDYCFMIDVTGAAPRFTHFGAWHAAFSGDDMTGRPLSELAMDTLAERGTRYLPEVLRRCIPITYGGSVEEPKGRNILYRSILLPLSDDSQTLTGVLGGANCRVVRDDD